MIETLTLIHTKQYGLDVWCIMQHGRTMHTFLSEQYARMRFDRIKQALDRAQAINNQEVSNGN